MSCRTDGKQQDTPTPGVKQHKNETGLGLGLCSPQAEDPCSAVAGRGDPIPACLSADGTAEGAENREGRSFSRPGTACLGLETSKGKEGGGPGEWRTRKGIRASAVPLPGTLRVNVRLIEKTPACRRNRKSSLHVIAAGGEDVDTTSKTGSICE
ncbi:hypothetical protein CORC01_12975 [Colletotrichum orchidophilum]|uniref:Uncharacterized protein n=1 Tax=Colletotrichum orchidophilum TaxID=1209926 RepID=A0A1G4ARF6_9PEZI|nr:uncharacterized protein CORC01_12975 [Colletotrichum orchidophilum]OHE91748.1 hypothetical protein CORC01_12975 [Colletotrichum orchidophilum]